MELMENHFMLTHNRGCLKVVFIHVKYTNDTFRKQPHLDLHISAFLLPGELWIFRQSLP